MRRQLTLVLALSAIWTTGCAGEDEPTAQLQQAILARPGAPTTVLPYEIQRGAEIIVYRYRRWETQQVNARITVRPPKPQPPTTNHSRCVRADHINYPLPYHGGEIANLSACSYADSTRYLSWPMSLRSQPTLSKREAERWCDFWFYYRKPSDPAVYRIPIDQPVQFDLNYCFQRVQPICSASGNCVILDCAASDSVVQRSYKLERVRVTLTCVDL